MDLDHLNMEMKIQSVSTSQRIISGYASYHNNLDRVHDIIDPVATSKAIARMKDPATDVAVFIGHNSASLPIGLVRKIEAHPQGMYTETYVLKGPAGDNLLAVAKDLHDHGQALGMSIGYKPRDSRREHTAHGMARRLLDLDVKEYSFAAHQSIANPLAITTGVKSRQRGRKALGEGGETAGGALVPEDRRGTTGMQYRLEKQGAKWAVLSDADADGDADDGRVIGTYDSQETATAVAVALRKAAGNSDTDDDDKTAPPPAQEVKSEWSTAAVNDLPDSSFLYVEEGATDDENKTVPRSKRHFPYKDAEGKVDLPHLRDAIGRIPQSSAPGLDASKKAQLQTRARRMLGDAEDGKTYAEPEEWKTGAPIALLSFAYQLQDIAADAVSEQKAMAVLGEDTRGSMRLRPEVRARIGTVMTDLGKFLDWADSITKGEDGARRLALLKHQLALTEV